MKRTKLNRDWSFMEGEPSGAMEAPKETRTVHLPHDFMIEADVDARAKGGSGVGFYPGGAGSYRKTLELSREDLMDVMALEFEGCFGLTKVLVNGYPAGGHHYGYTPFVVDIRPYVKIGTNKITVIVHNDAEPNSRWYSGAGLYRGVNLLTARKLHIDHDGIFVQTDHIAGDGAVIRAEVTLCGKKREEKDKDEVLLEFTCRDKESGQVVARGRQRACLTGEKTMTVTQKFTIENARLWSPDNPALYEMQVELYRNPDMEENGGTKENPDAGELAKTEELAKKGELAKTKDLAKIGEPVDADAVTFGIRTVSVDAVHGFVLNGKSMKLKGGCIHHDHGILGAKSFRDAEYRKVLLHKKNGYNALRLSHNPQSSALLAACDELGIIVMDEAFDVWNMEKNAFDFSLFFAGEWQQELRSILLRDRNHPCVCFWSIGNEVSEQGGLSQGYKVSSRLAKFVRKYDTTRPVCGALCSFFKGLNDEDAEQFWNTLAEELEANGGSLVNLDSAFGKKVWPQYTAPFVKDWDVVGYNYLSYHYESSHEMFPERVICATESKPGRFEEYWGYVEKLPYLIGDFLWTSQDYIGEAGIGRSVYLTEEEAQKGMSREIPYPYRLSQAGDFDLCGNVRAQGAYHQIIWGSDKTYIFSHNPANYDKVEVIGRYGWREGGNHWTWPGQERNPVKVEVYSAAEEVELWLNGKCLGRKNAGKENHRKAEFELTYEPGILEAVSYTGGSEVSRDKVETVGAPAGIRITMEKESLCADGESLAYGIVEIVDDEGRYVPTAPDTKAVATVTKAASLAGFGTGQAATEENYTAGCFTSYEGRWQIIVRGGYEPGEAEIVVETETFGKAETKLVVK